MEPRLKPVSDNAVLVSFADEQSQQAHDQVLALDRALSQTPPHGMVEAVPALVNVLVVFDPLATEHEAIQAALSDLLVDLEPKATKGKTHIIEVCYDPSFGPDLDAVAQATNLTRDGVIKTHLTGEYTALMYGFSPGYAYLGGVAKPIQIPRKSAPVRGVPAGSVIIAGQQCLITTLTMPTGWSILGRSPTKILTGNAARPFLFDVGDTIRFTQIDRETFDIRQGGDPE
ncbi:5-oxoprolinase subunit PxpB [Nereida sp. MMG025]|uniref:5-oxoprolinase subunit PxpB n=1 Tax=Nereida sp. MMG025 TaxID=2909981 RepID=UPI001F489D43|nr:5-oxoprolinase subunit PxpB [Nereida sp. MMG025]MCF6444224.1 5-oxoprolinase subunit PxpB [Nereida sp. MMG025]